MRNYCNCGKKVKSTDEDYADKVLGIRLRTEKGHLIFTMMGKINVQGPFCRNCAQRLFREAAGKMPDHPAVWKV